MALGSTLASLILGNQIPLLNGIAAFATLIGLQYVVTWTSVRNHAVNEFVRGSPTLVYYDGQFLKGRMRKERIVEDEIRAALPFDVAQARQLIQPRHDMRRPRRTQRIRGRQVLVAHDAGKELLTRGQFAQQIGALGELVRRLWPIKQFASIQGLLESQQV